ncbi:MAG: MotA/TolQ/ExbB proton channel family protein [Elusimicrobia bacterium]|nr:MotA/TolQ/ExbB proton channel family protein [Elusimicrobiota bacterium]
MDVLTILGFLLGFGVVYYVMVQGEITALLFNFTAFLLVFGGTIASTMITYPFEVMRKVPRAMLFIFSPPKQRRIAKVIDELMDLQAVYLSQGLDGLIEEMDKIDDEFLKAGIRMVVEDQSEEDIGANMNNELVAIRQRHQRIIGVFRSMGAYAPIFGLLGTLIGVVQVLRNLSDPASMGSSMAIAITTTFYGIFGCNFIFLPIAGKLDGYSNDESLVKELIISGIISIKERTLPALMKRDLERFLSRQNREKSGVQNQ